MQKRLNILFIFFLVFLLGCDKRLDGDTEFHSQQGNLRISFVKPVSPPGTLVTFTSKDSPNGNSDGVATIPVPSPDDFTIQIFNSDGEKIFDQLYGDLPYTITLIEGNYRILAQCGNNSIFSINDRYYKAEKNFVIDRATTTDVELVASLYGYLIQIVYGSDFAKNFKSYYVEAEINDISNGYVFARDGQDTRAYFAPSTVRLILKGVLIDDKPYSTVIYQTQSSGKQLHTLRLNILPKGHTFDISIDTQLDEILTEGQIPTDLLPEMPPIPSSVFEYYETTTQNVSGGVNTLDLDAVVGLSTLEFTFSGSDFAALGLAGTMSTTNVQQFESMVEAGIGFEPDLVAKMADPLTYLKRTKVDFALLAQKMFSHGAQASSYTIDVQSFDKIDRAARGSVKITILPVVFAMPEIVPGDVWTKSASFSPIGQMNVVHGNLERMVNSGRLKYQISSDGATWADIEEGKFSYNNELSSASTYFLRAIYGETPGTNVVSFTTEYPKELINADMESWTVEQVRLSTNSYNNYKPWSGADPQFWNTSNPRCFTYNGWPTQYNSPTSVVYTKSPRSGSRAAELRSVRINVGGRENVVGKLLIGTLTSGSANGLVSGSNNPENIIEGRPFASRPTKVRFWYKYNQYGADNYVVTIRLRNNDQIIAEKIVIGNGTNAEYQQMDIEIPYEDTTLKATSLYICFASSKDQYFDSRDIGVLYPDGSSSGWKAYVGSVLNIDDIELIYDK